MKTVQLELTLEEVDVLMSGLDKLRAPDTDVVTGVWFTANGLHMKLGHAVKALGTDGEYTDIAFSGEAYETFQRVVDSLPGYGVDVVTLDGERIADVALVGADKDAEMGDTVRIADLEGNELTTVRSVRVRRIEVA